MSKVSIIIPVFNTEKFIRQAIESALAQTYKNHEIIVVNDGSADKSLEICNRYQNQIRIITQDNQGVACARNTGIRESKGEYIALLDADDYWHPDKLTKQMEVFEKNSAVGIVHCGVFHVSEKNEIMKKGWGSSKNAKTGKVYRELYLRDLSITASSALFRKSCVRDNDYFDPYLTRLGCEDRDFWIRVSHDYDVAYVDESLVYFRITQGSMGKNPDKMLEASEYIIQKYFKRGWVAANDVKRAKGKIYRQWADSLLLGKDFQKAKKLYRKAIKNQPFELFHYINLIKASLKLTSFSGRKVIEEA